MNDTHRAILRTLTAAGYQAYVVGGSVRDTLLGRPSKDVDICTSATPAQVKALFGTVEFVGAHFGVSLVKTDEGDVIEVATFRTDGEYDDNRRPVSVKLVTDVREDLQRRDFTINALLMDCDGGVYDFVGGLDDLRNKTIRAIGDPSLRFQEDALRMLRAVRFACKLDFEIEHNTYFSIYNNAALLKNISAERIAGELNQILTSGNAAEGIDLLFNLGLIDHFIPEVVSLSDCPQNPKWHPEGNVYLHTLGLLKQLPAGCSLTLALGALLHDIGKPACLVFNVNVATGERTPAAHGHEEKGEPIAETILKRLKYPTDVIDAVKSHVLNHMTFAELPKMRKAKQLRFIRRDNFGELIELHRMDRMAATGDLTHYEYAKSLFIETPASVASPEPLITGHDLIALGLKPGPLFKDILHTVETLQLEGVLTTRTEALEFAKGYKEPPVD